MMGQELILQAKSFEIVMVPIEIQIFPFNILSNQKIG